MTRPFGLFCTLVMLIGCTAENPAPVGVTTEEKAKILAKQEHILRYVVTEATPGARRIWYLLDEVSLGEGKTGLSQALSLMAEMPKGSVVKLGNYQSGEDGGRYPFDVSTLVREGEKRGVAVWIPSGR